MAIAVEILQMDGVNRRCLRIIRERMRVEGAALVDKHRMGKGGRGVLKGLIQFLSRINIR